MSATLSRALNGLSAAQSAYSLLTGGGPVTLDDVVFRSFEVPERVDWGGTQAIAKHEFPGGARVVDAMGPMESDITWSGIMLGGGAESRAQQIDNLRKTGGEVPLIWGAFSRTVMVTSCSFQHGYQRIGYNLTCTVIPDDLDGVGGVAPSLLSQIDDDLSSALGFDVGGALSTAATAAQAIAAPLSIIAGGSPGTVSLIGSLTSAATIGATALTAADAAVSALATGDGNLLTSVSALPGMLAGVATDAGTAIANGYVGRALTNASNG